MEDTHALRILVVGAGATGGIFGGLLAQAGRDVTFLVRRQRAQQLRARGLRIRGPHGEVSFEPTLVETGAIERSYDVVLLGLKAYVLEHAIEDFAPAVGPETLILPMLNGMRHVDVLVERFGEERVLGGVCIVSSTLDEHGDIVQLFETQSLAYGRRDGVLSQRMRDVDALMQGCGFEATLSSHILQDMWDKWVFIAALGATTCLLRGNVGEIEAAGGASTASAILAEGAAVARAAGFPPGEATLGEARVRLTTPGSPLASSMYRDLQQGLAVEAHQILGDLVARASQAGVRVPLLEAANAQLAVYQNRRT